MYCGAVAQLGARLNGIEKVRGSSPLSSTKTQGFTNPLCPGRRGFVMQRGKRMKLIKLALVLFPSLLLACGAPTPTAELSPLPTPSGPLAIILFTDADSYSSSDTEIQLLLTNKGDTAVYLPACEPWQVLYADSNKAVEAIECVLDYLQHKIEPGETLVTSLPKRPEPGTYRVRAQVYGACNLGTPQISDGAITLYGQLYECAVVQEIITAPFDVE
jgi:hypothetical protein